MTNDEIINQALIELKNYDKAYIMFNELSFLKDLDKNDNRFEKVKFLLIKSEPFDKHSDSAIKFSTKGIYIISNYKDWFDYKKSLKPKIDYAKWIVITIALLSFAWNVYQGVTNNRLKDKNRILQNEIETLEKENASLRQQKNNN